MKKLMLGTALGVMAVTFAAPSFAREVTEVVGYVKTETIINDRDAKFREIDESGDGAINFKEFQKHALLNNEYEIFDMNDTNNDQLITIDEYRVFSQFGPPRNSEGPTRTTYNFNNSDKPSK